MKLLVAHFGRRAVVDALAGLTEVTPDEIERELIQLHASRTAKPAKRKKTAEEIVAAMPIDPARKELVLQLGRRFESGQFLPGLRDAEDFVGKHGGSGKNFKGRKDSLVAVLRSLCEMPESELQALLAHRASSSEQGDYATLANRLMGKKTAPEGDSGSRKRSWTAPR